MSPHETQQQSLDALEQLGGKPVVLLEDASLKTHAKIHVAAASEQAHVLTYNPAIATELPYLVCFQCGLAERALRSAPDERFNVASTPATYASVQQFVLDMKTIPAELVVQYTQMITDGLGTQLRSMPIGIRIDRAIYNVHPELRAMQRTLAEKHIQDGVACLQPAIKAMAPDLLFVASAAMSAAMTLTWSRLWNDDTYVVPYRLAGHLALAEKLLVALDTIPDTPHHDRELVSSWATILGIDHLFQIGPVGL